MLADSDGRRNARRFLMCAESTVAVRRSVDAVAKEPGGGAPTSDYDALFKELLTDCKYGPDSVSG